MAQILTEMVGRYAHNFDFLPVKGTREAILLAANENFYKLTAVHFRTNIVSVKLEATTSFDGWWITGLFGPQEDNEKLIFPNELRQIHSTLGQIYVKARYLSRDV